MKRTSLKRTQGFTLVEMIGVLAVIAVLAAILIPRVFAAINESRLNNAVASVNTVKSAAMQYFGKYGRFGTTNGSALSATSTNWDNTLLQTGMLEKPFDTRVGATNSAVQAILVTGTPTTAIDNLGGYDLDNNGAVDTLAAQTVIEVVLKGLATEDCREIDERIDGTTLSSPNGTSDAKGRVKWNNAGEMHIYVAHK